MKDLTYLNGNRIDHPMYGPGDAHNGAFKISFMGCSLLIIAAAGDNWDHVSVSLENRCPHWREMQFVRERFFEADVTVVQIHPPLDQHINVHPHCLHLWRAHGIADITLPPREMIA